VIFTYCVSSNLLFNCTLNHFYLQRTIEYRKSFYKTCYYNVRIVDLFLYYIWFVFSIIPTTLAAHFITPSANNISTSHLSPFHIPFHLIHSSTQHFSHLPPHWFLLHQFFYHISRWFPNIMLWKVKRLKFKKVQCTGSYFNLKRVVDKHPPPPTRSFNQVKILTFICLWYTQRSLKGVFISRRKFSSLDWIPSPH